MSILNSKSNMFQIWIPKNFFYPEIEQRWTPVVKRLKLQYQTLEDFVNATIQGVTFPEMVLGPVNQPQTMFNIKYRGGKELEPILDKNLTITFKLMEGFITYWMICLKTLPRGLEVRNEARLSRGLNSPLNGTRLPTSVSIVIIPFFLGNGRVTVRAE